MEKSLSIHSTLVGGGYTAADQRHFKSACAEAASLAGRDPLDQRGCLLANRILRDLSPDEMKLITGSARRTTVPKGKTIYTPGEMGEVLFLLCQGSVHLYRLSSEGRKFIVQTIGQMTFFGEMAILGQNLQDHFAETAKDCTLCVMGRADVKRLILSKPQVALRMLEEIGQRMHEVQERLGDSAFKGIPARVASLLLKLSQTGAQPIKGISHQDLAEMLGVYRETVTNTLDHLQDEGIIGLGRKKISILNRDRLCQVAEEEVLRKRDADSYISSA
jgi:CRP-like cAMP-binding protein